jgi:hypothetical protein
MDGGKTNQFLAITSLPNDFGLVTFLRVDRLTLGIEDRFFFFWSSRPIVLVVVVVDWGGLVGGGGGEVQIEFLGVWHKASVTFFLEPKTRVWA